LSPFGFSFNKRNKTPPLAGFIDHAVCHAPQSLWLGFAALRGALKAWRGGESLRGRIPFLGKNPYRLAIIEHSTFPFLSFVGQGENQNLRADNLSFIGRPLASPAAWLSLAPPDFPWLPKASPGSQRLPLAPKGFPKASRKAPGFPQGSPGSPRLPARFPARQGSLSLLPRRLSLAGSVRGVLACFVVSKPAAPGGWA
jgi:hypothetical protein